MTEILTIEPSVVVELAARQRQAAQQLRALRTAIDMGVVSSGMPGSDGARACWPLVHAAADTLAALAERIDALAVANAAAAQQITTIDSDNARRLYQVSERGGHG